jgi:hypothetical protein
MLAVSLIILTFSAGAAIVGASDRGLYLHPGRPDAHR